MYSDNNLGFSLGRNRRIYKTAQAAQVAPVVPAFTPAYVPTLPVFSQPQFINADVKSPLPAGIDVKSPLPAGIKAQADYTKNFKEANPLIFGVSQTAALAYGAGLLVLFLLIKKPKRR